MADCVSISAATQHIEAPLTQTTAFRIAVAGFVVKIKFKFPPGCNLYRSTGGELLRQHGLPVLHSRATLAGC